MSVRSLSVRRQRTVRLQMSPGKELFDALQLPDALQVPESRVQRGHSFQTASAQLLHLCTPVETSTAEIFGQWRRDLEPKLELSPVSKCLPYLACFIVSSNMENSLSLSACREQNTDSWKPGLDFSLLTKHIRVGGKKVRDWK